MEKEEENKLEILYIGFNQDNKCFSVGTNIGFRIYNTDPFKLNFERSNSIIIFIIIINYRTWWRDFNGSNVIQDKYPCLSGFRE